MLTTKPLPQPLDRQVFQFAIEPEQVWPAENYLEQNRQTCEAKSLIYLRAESPQ